MPSMLPFMRDSLAREFAFIAQLCLPQSQAPGHLFRGPSHNQGLCRAAEFWPKQLSESCKKNSSRSARLNAPLRPLNNIITPAIAVEFSPKGGDLQSPESLKMQNAVASAVAAGIATHVDRWEYIRDSTGISRS